MPKLIYCKVCRKTVYDGIYLSDGRVVHESCLDHLQNEVEGAKKKIYAERVKLEKAIHEIERRQGLMSKIISIFSRPDVNTIDIEIKISTIENNIIQLSNNLLLLQANIAPIYDYFLSYPPDWDERRNQVIERDGYECTKCGDFMNLQLHHLKSLSNGGSNKITNLKLLCEKCHSRKHGGRNFSGVFSNSETAFSKRVSNIRHALNNGKKIKFVYKKPNENKYKQRIIHPSEIINLDHQRDSGSTLCVRGYCELRKADRTFALKRMKGLKII